jgi:hypothetical protein
MANDRVPRHKQRLATNQQEAPNSVSSRQAPYNANDGGNDLRKKSGTSPSGAKLRTEIKEKDEDKE